MALTLTVFVLRCAGPAAANGAGPAAQGAATVNAAAVDAPPSRAPPPRPLPPPWINRTAAIAVQRVDVCALNACEAYVRMRDDLASAVRPINDRLRGDGSDGGGGADKTGGALEDRLQRLDRRLRSVEQPGEY